MNTKDMVQLTKLGGPMSDIEEKDRFDAHKIVREGKPKPKDKSK